ncbi:MAG: hypothetical protein AB7Q29_16065 [Vicinamibacterales bacterium]
MNQGSSLGSVAPSDLEALRVRAAATVQKLKTEGQWAGGVEAHTAYAKKPVEWMVKYLDLPEHTIRWSANPEYQNCYCPRCVSLGVEGGPHQWDGDADPLVKALECMSQGQSFAVSSGTGTAKTHTIAAAGTLFFLAVFERSIVFSVAPKYDLLLKNMWKEVGNLWPRFKRHFPQAELLTGNLRMLPGQGEQELWAATAFGAGVGANEELAQRLKGFHAAKMFWMLEETPGIPTPIIETIIKTCTDDFNFLGALGNPEHQHDPLAQLSKRSWVTAVRISALDFPNVVTGRSVIPGGRSRKSVERDLADCDGQEDHPHYLSQVRGIAPAQSRRALIRWEWLEQAAERYAKPEFRVGAPAIGIDPADSPTGDLSAISRWQGACCTEVVAFHTEDASAVADEVYKEITDEEYPVDPKHVGVDSIGVGASTVNELKKRGIRVKRISSAKRAVPSMDWEARYSKTETDAEGRLVAKGPIVPEEETYANTRSQVLWRLREDLRLQRIALPKDKGLFEELTAIEYEVPNGKITVTPKDDTKAILGHSPNKADAVAYGNFARPRIPLKKAVAPSPTGRVGEREHGLEEFFDKHAKEQAKIRRQRKMLARATRRRKR